MGSSSSKQKSETSAATESTSDPAPSINPDKLPDTPTAPPAVSQPNPTVNDAAASDPLHSSFEAPPSQSEPLLIPGKKEVEEIEAEEYETYEDDTNQTGLSHYEIRIQDSFYSTPHRPRSRAYNEMKEATAARRLAKQKKKQYRTSKKNPDPVMPELVPHTIPWAISNTKKLGVFNLSRMDLDALPDGIFDEIPGTARIINLAFNRFSQLDQRVCDYVLVQRLIANANFLTEIPPNISRMTALKKIDLARNKLSKLPDSFATLRSLEHVDLADNQLSELPPSFSTLNLTALNLSRNRFSKPPALHSITSLLDLDLSSNSIDAVPAEWASLVNLIAMNLDENQIAVFPPAIFESCDQMITLRLRQNPIKMHTLRNMIEYQEFEQRRRMQLKRQIDTGTITLNDLLPADD